MTRPAKSKSKRTVEPGGRQGIALLAACLLLAATAPVLAQGWWPWSGPSQQRPAPVPREPVYRDPVDPDAPPLPQQQGAPGGTWSKPNSICLQLEQSLVQEGQRGNQSRDQIPAIDNELRQQDQTYRSAQQQLERADCYDYFLFSKTLRRTRRCIDLANQVDATRRRIGDLETQRQQLMASAGHSYRDDIVRELARNNCGASYEQQARRQEGTNPFASLWEEEDTSSGGLGNYGNVPYATYRTVCVRLCDGYYFPISFSTLPNHFQRDAEACQSKCAAPAQLYYYQNPGASVEQAVAAGSNEPYTQLKSAFRYRKEYVSGCSCKTAEFVPDPGDPQQQGAAPAENGDGSNGQLADAPPGELPWQPR
jgi:hypothetical protein